MNILGISAYYHDSAAAIIQDGKIIAAAQEERFTRKKHDAAFPSHAIQFCLEQAGLTLNELDAIVFYDKPFLKFERLIETYYYFAPKGIRSFITAIPIWLKEKLFLKRELKLELKNIGEVDYKKTKLLFTEHHLSHAASAFYSTNFTEAAILTIDGVGEWSTASICYGENENISVIKEMHFPNSVGLLYSAFTYYLGFKVNSGEYKLMGLAPYGNKNSEEVKSYINSIKNEIVTIYDDGSIQLNQKYFNYAVGLTMTNDKAFENLFQVKRRKPEEAITQVHCNMALAIQEITEEIVLKLAQTAKQITGSENLCLAGGVALNCVANGKLINAKIFKNVFVQPAAGDAGGALGAALAVFYLYFKQTRKTEITTPDILHGSYLGPSYSNKEISSVLKKHKAVYHFYDDKKEVFEKTAQLINEQKTIGWFQGSMEFGPRALGNRSIIADARSSDMQMQLNLKVKFRESFRPFAPSVLFEYAQEYFETENASPYMLEVQPIKNTLQNTLPQDYDALAIKDKLYISRSSLPAITHVDNTARIQTVHKETNENYWQLLQAFYKLTGCAVIINTSFNVRGEPIVCSPEDAYRCFMRTNLDVLVLENYILHKAEQPAWQEKELWQESFTLD